MDLSLILKKVHRTALTQLARYRVRAGAAAPRPAPPRTAMEQHGAADDKPRWGTMHYHTLATIFIAYASGMYAKGTTSLAIFGMGKDAALGFSATDISSMLALGTVSYSVGKLVGGPVSDMAGGRNTLSATLMVIGVCKLFMSRSSSLLSLTSAWVVARLAHAFMWMGCMLMVRPWFEGNGQSSALSVVTSSSRVGAFLGSFAGGILLALPAGWRGLTRSTGVVALVAGALQLTLRSKPPVDATGPSATATSAPSSKKMRPKKMSARQVVQIVLSDPKLWAVYGSTMLTIPTFDLTSLLPMYLDTLGMAPSQIGTLGSVFPLAAVPAILISAQLHQRLTAKARTMLYAPLLCVSAACLLVFSKLRTASTIIIAPLLIAIMAGVAPALYVPNYLYILRFGGPFVGTLTGICDLFGNALTALVYSVYPRLLARGGWPLVFRVYAAMNVGAAACIGVFTVLEARQELQTSPFEETDEDEDEEK